MQMGGPQISEGKAPGTSRLRIFLYILLALGGVGVLTCGGLIFFAARNPAIRQFVETMVGSQSAPGAQQLREAGCTLAQVFDFESALGMLAGLEDTHPSQGKALMDLTMVQCVLPAKAENGPDCDEVARIYSSAVPDPPQRFLVQVVVQRSSNEPCQVVYEADATPIATLDEYLGEASKEPAP